MSRTLSKVMVICALIAVLPLMIVGTAFAAYYSVDNIVNIATVYVGGEKSPIAAAQVTYNGKSAESFQIKEGHTTSVEVKAGSTPAYTFKGWYLGNKDAYTDKVQDEAKLTIKMEEEKDYVAVYEVVKYNVSWNYKANPTDANAITTTPNGYENEFIYGETLPTLNYSGVDYKYKGWKVDGDATGKRYERATFASTNVTLVEPWMESDKITVTFHNGDKTVSKEIVAEEPWTIPQISDPIFEGLGINTNGYSYTWSDEDGVVTSISSKVDVNLEISEPTPITYTAKLKDASAYLADGVSAKDVEFTVENYSGFEAWLNLETKHDFWKIEGIKYGTTTYTSDTLADLAVAYAKDSTAEFELVVNKYFTKLSVSEGVQFLADSKESESFKDYTLPVFVGQNNYDTNNPHEMVSTSSVDVENQTMNKLFEIEDTVYTQKAVEQGAEQVIEQWIVELAEVQVTVNERTFNVTTTADEKIVDFIEKVYAQIKSNTTLGEELTITSMVAHYNFDSKVDAGSNPLA